MPPEWGEDFGQRDDDFSPWDMFRRKAEKVVRDEVLKELEGLHNGVPVWRKPEELTDYDKDFLLGCKISIDNF